MFGEDALGREEIKFLLTTILPVWISGLVIGLLVPRHAPVLSDVRAWLGTGILGWVSLGAKSTTLSQIMMFVNGAMFIQSLWYRWTEPGTFHGLCARVFGSKAAAPGKDGSSVAADQRAEDDGKAWHIDEHDLEFFRSRVERGEVQNAGPWETMLEKDIPGALKYHSQRRMLKDIKKTEYLTTSITADSRPQEVCQRTLFGGVTYKYRRFVRARPHVLLRPGANCRLSLCAWG